MRCLNPITIPNTAKFWSPSQRHPFLSTVRCGRCVGCQSNKASEWSFRAYKHAEDCFSRGGYMLFDTLTYANEFVPRLSQYDEFSSLNRNEDYMCFRSEDLRLFFVRLRKRLRSRGFGKDAFNYFVSSEYGTDDRFTHRPHYHCLFYIYADVDPLDFSKLVSSCWPYGRTDGLPYKSASYVLSNVFRSFAIGSRRVVNYVTKYVQKSSKYEKEITKRINKVLHRVCPDPNLLHTPEYKELRRSLNRLVAQFHRQSLRFGITALNDIDEYELFSNGFFKMPNGKPTMFNKIPIPTYFLRKLLYHQVVDNQGYKVWELHPEKLGLWRLRNQTISKGLIKSVTEDSINSGVVIPDVPEYVDYLLHYKGRYMADSEELPFNLRSRGWFVYASQADINHFGVAFVTNQFLGTRGAYLRPVEGIVALPLSSVIDSELFNQTTIQAINPSAPAYDDIASQLAVYYRRCADEIITLNEKRIDIKEKTMSLFLN